MFYISAFSMEDGGCVQSFRMEDGCPVRTGVAALPGAGYMALSADASTLFVTCSAGGKGDALAMLSAGENGELGLVAIEPSLGVSSCHVALSPDGRFAYTANYRSGSFTEFAIGRDGLRRTQVIVHEGRGPHPVRQSSPHVHFCSVTPDERYVAVVDLGLDTISCYPYSSESGIGAKPIVSRMSPGSGPRHFVFTADGRTAYLVNELGNTISTLEYMDGVFRTTATTPTLPFPSESSKAGAIRLSDDGRTLLVSNRGVDTIVAFEVSADGMLEKKAFAYSGGKSPRDINWVDDGLLAVCNEYSPKVCFMDPARNMEPTGREMEIPRPLCVIERTLR
ncbi:MAG: lactonase family protein [Victivallaceae bacterium]|nr:lactonase family protein [Victivallaceae bacterium]